jgi:5'-deoxynucleotidase YfbR-like HD superfamily hydrolase
MTEVSQGELGSAQQAHDQLLRLGEVCVGLAGITRTVSYPDGRPEDDAQHSLLLGMAAAELAANYYPDIDPGLVAQFSFVHDLVEVELKGDIPTFIMSPEGRAAKEAAEKEAVQRLLPTLPPHTAQLLRRYEAQTEPAARIVRFVDKLLPAVIHAVAPDANRQVFRDIYGMGSAEDVMAGRAARTAWLQEMFPEFDLIHAVRHLISATSRQRIFGAE